MSGSYWGDSALFGGTGVDNLGLGGNIATDPALLAEQERIRQLALAQQQAQAAQQQQATPSMFAGGIGGLPAGPSIYEQGIGGLPAGPSIYEQGIGGLPATPQAPPGARPPGRPAPGQGTAPAPSVEPPATPGAGLGNGPVDTSYGPQDTRGMFQRFGSWLQRQTGTTPTTDRAELARQQAMTRAMGGIAGNLRPPTGQAQAMRPAELGRPLPVTPARGSVQLPMIQPVFQSAAQRRRRLALAQQAQQGGLLDG